MHIFHGIRRAFLEACGGSLSTCLPLLPFHGVEEEAKEAVNADLQLQPQEGHYNGDLQPTKGGKADQSNLPPVFTLLKSCLEKGDHLPISVLNQPLGYGGLPQSGEDGGNLLPKKEDEGEADNVDLQPYLPAHVDEEAGAQKPADNYDLRVQALCEGRKMGCLLPVSGEQEEEEGFLLPNVRGEGYIHDDLGEGYLQPEYKDGENKSHQEDLSFLHSQYAYVIVLMFVDETNVVALDGLKIQVFDPGGLPFTPLRGRRRYQGRELQESKKMLKQKMLTKAKKWKTQTEAKMPMIMMQLWLFYLTKDVLDPG